MGTDRVFFDDWPAIGRVALLAVQAYGALVFVLRVSGKRTLAKMNVFDFVFVVALGSTLANTILNPDASLATGIAALVALIALQILLSWVCMRSEFLDRWINGQLVLVLHRGRFLHAAMRRERVTEEEVRAAVRNRGMASLDDVEAVVLETDGTFSVVGLSPNEAAESALRDVAWHPAVAAANPEAHDGALAR